ncbi:MAG: hypothetical protein WEA54_03720 [Actinomycetota bacterium]
MGRLRAVVPLALSGFLVIGTTLTLVPASATSGGNETRAAETFRDDPTVLTTPQLIDRAADRGRISRARGNLLLAFAFARPDRLPPEYRSDALAEGTILLLRLHRVATRSTPIARRIAEMIGAGTRAGNRRAQTTPGCSSSTTPLPSTITTPHFLISYDPSRIGAGLTLQDYVAALESAWATEIDSFGWAAPPPGTGGGRYHVRLVRLKGFYGYVSPSGTHAGLVGDNPSTSWDDVDAYASCMVLNANLFGVSTRPREALDATAAHELNHAIQFGYGALIGPDRPDDVFVEGGATWIEDEVVDAADDNHQYLWPSFYDAMGTYADSPYGYWVVFRALTEPYGAGVVGGGEDVLQRFWQSIGKRNAENLDALRAGVGAEGHSLGEAFQASAIRLRVLRTCGALAYAPPVCLEEAGAYMAAAGKPPLHGKVTQVGESYRGGVKDDFGLNWVGIPTGSIYRVRLANTAGGGQLRISLVCDDGTSASVRPASEVLGPGQATSIPDFDARACASAWAVVTNQKQNGPNPSTSATRTYAVATSQS